MGKCVAPGTKPKSQPRRGKNIAGTGPLAHMPPLVYVHAIQGCCWQRERLGGADRPCNLPPRTTSKTEELEETGKLTSGGLTLHLGSGLCGVQWCHVHIDGAGAASSTSRAGRTAATKDATPFIAASNGQLKSHREKKIRTCLLRAPAESTRARAGGGLGREGP